jgi:hypothetical protein
MNAMPGPSAMNEASGLRRLQRWFAYCVGHPKTADVAIRSRAGNALVASADVAAGRVLVATARRPAAAGLQVYNGGYLMRLHEVMAGDFGAVQHLVGAEAFHRLVARYVAAHPSRHPNLNQLGRHFPSFLRRQRGLTRRAFAAELASLELALSIAFDAPEFTSLAADALAKVDPRKWARARFAVNPSVHLLATRYPVDLFYQAWKDGKPIPAPPQRSSWTLVFRRDDRVWRQRLVRPAHAVLSALVAGKTLARALGSSAASEQVGQWFADFRNEGLFTAVSVAATR